jgi:hypothetical protein
MDVAVIYGIVFNDINANGIQDWGEPGINDTEITLDGADIQMTTQHGFVSGMYSSLVDTAGAHTVEETNFYGYRSTTPDLVVVPVELGDSYPVNFGDTVNQEVAAIYGTVFDDLNSNGIQDSGELGLAGVEITMTVGTEVETTITKSYGQYTYGFEPNEAGYHMIQEQDPAQPGYHSTTPDQVKIGYLASAAYKEYCTRCLPIVFKYLITNLFS